MSAARRKGTAFETAVVAYLRASGFRQAERRALGGVNDRGDIAGLPGVVIECKAAKRLELAQWADETEAERHNDDADYGVLVVKRRQRSTGNAYAILPLSQLVALLGERDR